MNRREMIRAGFGIGAIAATATVGWSLYGKAERNLARKIRESFPYLTFSDELLEQFCSDVSSQYGTPKEEDMDQVRSIFLLSTDFFLNGADESKALKYTVLYHPLINPCSNPLIHVLPH
jgi:hypothetical protein